jgi:hypothetical protein
MSDDHAVLICRPTSSHAPPTIGSTRRWCEVCADEVWTSPSSLAHAETSGLRVMIVCEDCGLGLMRMDPNATIEPPTPAEMQVIRRTIAEGG